MALVDDISYDIVYDISYDISHIMSYLLKPFQAMWISQELASPTYSTCRGLIKFPGQMQKQEQVKTKGFRFESGLKAPAYLRVSQGPQMSTEIRPVTEELVHWAGL
jgi:hypothetical protein